MFSSLLSKPQKTPYSRPIRLDSGVITNTKALVLPTKQTTAEVISKNEDSLANNSSISKYYLNKDGTLNYNMTIAAANSKGRFHSSYEDTVPLKKRFPNLKHNFPKYDGSSAEVQKCVDETRSSISKLMGEHTGDKKPEDVVQYATYTSTSVLGEERGRETQIQIKNYQQDPMLPPKHKLRKNRHKEPSPPPPVLKSAPSASLTKEDQAKWSIPASISNWKNSQGFTISLDKRMVAASSNETPEVNLEKLSGLTSALDEADKQAREDIRERNEIRKKMAERQQREKQQKLNELAEMSRKRGRQDGNESNKRNRH